MKLSKIGFTDYSGGDANFVLRGKHDCECSPGCQNCFMAVLDRRFNILPETTTWYPEKLERLAKAKFPEFSPKRGAPYRPMVLVCDGGDLFHETVPFLSIASAFAMMLKRRDITWQVLTKRADRMKDFFVWWYPQLRNHIWLGVSVEDQKRAEERIPLLLETPTAVRFVSLEPLLSPVNLTPWLHKLGFIILGAESGPNRRPFDKDWARAVRDQCLEAGTPFHYKQSSGLYPGTDPYLDGRIWQEWPC